MNYVNLPNLSLVTTNHFELRVQAARAVSSLEVQAARGVDVSAAATQLRDFFWACSNACVALIQEPAP